MVRPNGRFSRSCGSNGSTQSSPWGDRPLVVLSRGMDTDAERDATFAQLALISSNSRHTVVPKAGHEIHLFEPRAVIQAVRDVIESARQKTRLPPRRP